MYQPRFKILKEDFPSDQCICLGPQLAIIVGYLQEILSPHIWYAADIYAIGELSVGLSQNYDVPPNLEKFGNDTDMLTMCSEVMQFLSGVFFAIDIQHANQKIEYLKVWTEDEKFRSLPINGVLIEIRTIDTSYFEIYSEDENVIKQLAKKLNLDRIQFNFTK